MKAFGFLSFGHYAFGEPDDRVSTTTNPQVILKPKFSTALIV